MDMTSNKIVTDVRSPKESQLIGLLLDVESWALFFDEQGLSYPSLHSVVVVFPQNCKIFWIWWIDIFLGEVLVYCRFFIILLMLFDVHS